MEDTCGKQFELIGKLLEECIESPDLFIEPQPETAKKFIYFAKLLYNRLSQSQNGTKTKVKSLPKLLTKGFDAEQIWQQLELRNDDVIKQIERKLGEFSNYLTGSDDIEEKDLCGSFPEDSDSNVDSDEDGYVFDDDDDSEVDEVANIAASNESEDDNLKDDVQKTDTDGLSKKKAKSNSKVNDKFFNLSQMEQFLKMEDLREEKGGLSSGEESDEINLFEDIPSDDFEDMDIGDDSGEDCNIGEDDVQDFDNVDFSLEKKRKSKDIMYEDFFDPPDSSDEGKSKKTLDKDCGDDDDNEEEENVKNQKYDTRDYVGEEAEDDDIPQSDDGGGDSDKDEPTRSKTAFEKQQEKVHKRILEMEESLLKPKPWQLTGEVAASNRPENSLLHQQTTFDSNVRQELISTDELTARVEEIVRLAVVNKAWSDVERKVKPVAEVMTPFKKPVEIEQTKSKKGLAELYEDEYLKKQSKTDETEGEDPKHVEINKLMDQLLPELNALFAYIPKPAVPEISVVSNLPAVALEDVAPVALSDATLLAPEEIKRRMSGEIKGKTERTSTDKKRERRKKKAYQKIKQKKTEDKMRELAATSPGIAAKHEKLMALKKLKQSRNAKIISGDKSEKIKSSKDFFSRLDDLTRSKSGPKEKKTLSAKSKG